MSDINVTLNENQVIAVTISNTGIAMASTAANISTSTTNFNNNLSASDTTVQLALDTLDNMTKASAIGVSFTNNSVVLSSGTTASVRVPYPCTITQWDVLSMISGTLLIDVKKSTYANYPVLSTITGTDKLLLLGNAYKGTSTALTGWTLNVTAGDVLKFDIEQATQSGTVTAQLRVNKI